jgi:alpha-ketoglutarate-dependent taurine dioxygenase
MKITKIPGLGSRGIYIDDVDLNHISDEEWLEIGHLYMQNLVTILRNVTVDKERYPELMAKWGQQRVPTGMGQKFKQKYGHSVKDIFQLAKTNPELLDAQDQLWIKSIEEATERTSNGYVMMKVAGGYTADGVPNGMFSEGELLWHSNESGTLTFTPSVSLLGWKNMVGSSTGFVQTADYYENISNSFRSELDDMIVIHRFIPNKIGPGIPKSQDDLLGINMVPENNKEVPLVLTSPGGMRGLHYSINTAWQIKGMSLPDSHILFERINKELFTESNIYDHWYQQDNDLLLFDNTITLHRRIGYIDGRVALRNPHDFTNLQTGPWLPYADKPKYQRQYNREIRKIVRQLGITGFKLPPTGLLEILGL